MREGQIEGSVNEEHQQTGEPLPAHKKGEKKTETKEEVQGETTPAREPIGEKVGRPPQQLNEQPQEIDETEDLPESGELRQFGAEGRTGDPDIEAAPRTSTAPVESIGSRVSGTVGEGRAMLSNIEGRVRNLAGDEAGRAVSSVTRRLDGVLSSGQQRIAEARNLANEGDAAASRARSAISGLRQEIPTDGSGILNRAGGALKDFGSRALSDAAQRFGNTTSWDTTALSSRFSSGLGTTIRDANIGGGDLGGLEGGLGGLSSAAGIGEGAAAAEGGEELGELTLL